MTLVLLEKGLVLQGSTPKIEDKQVPGRSITPAITPLRLVTSPCEMQRLRMWTQD